MSKRNIDIAKLALQFVVIVGVANFFADFTYEGARSVIGPFLGSLGASATAVGFVAGFGEMAGYCLRSVSGYIADKTRRYWATTFLGYAINMFAVPALALAGNWPLAAALIVAERTGRAIRKPTVESMLSQAGNVIGHGWVFGLNEALDQVGATLGPMVTAFILYRHGGYQRAFSVLLVTAVLCLAVLVAACVLQPGPLAFGEQSFRRPVQKGFPRAFRLYLIAGALIAAGFADFSLIGFHFQKSGTVSQGIIPLYYSVAMATGAIASLLFGRRFDKKGLPVLLIAFGAPAFFAPLVFLAKDGFELVGMILWGMGMGAQDSCLKAALSTVVSSDRGSTAFGWFDTVFGLSWFAGSAIMGMLYGKSIHALTIFSVALQLSALPLFVLAGRNVQGHLGLSHR